MCMFGQAHGGWQQFWAQIERDMAACPRVSVSEAQMETLRAAVSSKSTCNSAVSASSDGVGGNDDGVPVAVIVPAVVGGLAFLCLLVVFGRRGCWHRKAAAPPGSHAASAARGYAGAAPAQPTVPLQPPVVVTATAVPASYEPGVAMGVPVQFQ